ncbi:hypothetical protein RF11_08217 [Thelohanellus kitauei]|uniref:Uncharacterized protein n=1 Tax=Thelohanellus kitauei TaxID=669202 RepID=A0A0C2N2J6_THEKT|nr:hypothetical protein RF11_08217 [Thelohanellus kitauei]
MDQSISFCYKQESINIEPLSLKLNKRIILEKHQSFISTNKKGSTHGGQSDCVIEIPMPHKDQESDSYKTSHYDVSSDPDRSNNSCRNKISVKMDKAVSFCDERESINSNPLSVKSNKLIMHQSNQSEICTQKEVSSHDDESDSDIEMMLPPPETIPDFSSEIIVAHKSQYSDCGNLVQLLIKKYSQNFQNQAHYDR